MELILKETISTLGREGDLVNVKAGFGRNYLLPQQKAVAATQANVAELEKNQAEIKAKIEKESAIAEKIAKKISGIDIVIEQLAGEDGRLFGSVTNADIAAKLAESDIKLDKRQIVLNDPIKTVSETIVLVKVGFQVSTEILVKVQPISAD
ncbi:MAG: 50S ribosomal protein L9 [Desulfotalea sp.]